MTDLALIERITRSLAFMLRHQPETFDLELDPHGYADLEDVVHALNERLGEPVEEEDVREAVRSGDRPRYEIQGDRIRALYGHSIPVEPGPSSKPPERLFVAVPEQELERARRFGLRGGRRRFLHLAITRDDAAESGRRASRDYTVLTIRALDAWEEGISFYDRTSLWLAEEVPTHLLEVEGTYHDGTDPLPRHFEGQRERGGHERERSHDYRGGGGGGGGGRGGGRGRGGRGRDRYRGGAGREGERGGDRGGSFAPAGGGERGRRPGRFEGEGNRGGFRESERREPRESREPREPSEPREPREPAFVEERAGPVENRHEGRREGRPDEHRRGRRDERTDDRRPPRHEEQRPAPREPRQERAAAPRGSERPGGFGAGLESREERGREERAAPPPPPAPEPPPRTSRPPVESDGPGFGAGL